MADEVLVKVDHVSKKFCRDLKQSLWYGVQDIMSEVTARKYEHELRKGEFWSVNDISFELRRGECLGLIGPNGAGKSTLLKILNGLIKPDKGRIELRGRIGALIELSAGFNGILTGRENIYSRGAVLGFTKEEIDKKLDAIIDFSELEEFIDTPVVNYSSGMKVRLGFAVAAQMEPDVLLLDEVLAVGDVGFRAKCFNSIYKMMKNAAVILVSHSMPQINRVCSDILVMNHGQPVFQGKDVPKGIDKFYSYFQGEEGGIILGNGQATIHHISLNGNDSNDIVDIAYAEKLWLDFRITVNSAISKFDIIIGFLNQELQIIAQSCSNYQEVTFVNKNKAMDIKFELDNIILNPGTYSLFINILTENNGEVLCKHYNIRKFNIVGHFYGYAPVQFQGNWTF
ncbi:ATP-binding protein of ABC transporter [Crocosphaera subtropica ATCC 51142]|uniref:ATP-binding protein of ABC transporter n=1 Tax=Crocosphaera subtropica (strain ATCC 51142 / BH68) TaxID=43989 RepID=B1WVA7_CROS5|nr:ABC transporter ATP-binding protein [Crocosphaera subtropica]ACB53897.1 ATP-binding protein of ABC transporter [Crocosphaera subtropica ATCC 51142]